MLDANWMIKGDQLESYLNACRNADISCFKQNVVLRKIFEHCSVEAAWNYLKKILNDNPKLLLNSFTNDHYGNPDVQWFGFLMASPSTLQYIGVLCNLIRLYGPLDDLRIVEIGGGYGGQCRTIMDVFKPACYHIVDLPEVCELQCRYCNAECFTEPTGEQYDLVISNYALSEVPDNQQYIDEVLKRSKHGYITCNTDLLTLDWDHKRSPDIAGESAENYILTW